MAVASGFCLTKHISTAAARASGTIQMKMGVSASLYEEMMASLIGAGSWLTTAGVSEFEPPGVPPPLAAAGRRSASSSASLLAKRLPTTAEPRVAPICRKKLFDAVAVPTSRSGKEFCTISTMICMLRPSPRPITAR